MSDLIMNIPQASMYNFMTNIEKVIISDEVIMRLLVYKPESYDREKEIEYLNPMSTKLPNIVDNSKEYWNIVTDRVRKGEKNTDIEGQEKCYIYIHEGRDREIFKQVCQVNQEVVFSVYVQQDFEKDWRMSQIRDRLTHLFVYEIGIAGYGKMQYLGGDPRDAPTGYRRIDYRYQFTTAKKRQ